MPMRKAKSDGRNNTGEWRQAVEGQPHYARVRQQEMLKVVIGEILENEDKLLKESGKGLSRN